MHNNNYKFIDECSIIKIMIDICLITKKKKTLFIMIISTIMHICGEERKVESDKTHWKCFRTK